MRPNRLTRITLKLALYRNRKKIGTTQTKSSQNYRRQFSLVSSLALASVVGKFAIYAAKKGD